MKLGTKGAPSKRPHGDAVAPVSLRSGDLQRVQTRVGVKHDLRTEHHRQPDQFWIPPFVTDDRGGRHSIDSKECQRFSGLEEPAIPGGKMDFGILENRPATAIDALSVFRDGVERSALIEAAAFATERGF